MKHIRKFNESFEDDRQISEEEINIFLDNGVTVNVYLTDLLSDTNLILLMKNGEIYERRSGNIKFDIYSSKEEFKTKTGASLDDEYKGNASQALMNLFDEVQYTEDGLDYQGNDIVEIHPDDIIKFNITDEMIGKEVKFKKQWVVDNDDEFYYVRLIS